MEDGGRGGGGGEGGGWGEEGGRRRGGGRRGGGLLWEESPENKNARLMRGLGGVQRFCTDLLVSNSISDTYQLLDF